MYALYKIDKERLGNRKMSMYEPAVKVDGVNCSIAKQVGYKFDVYGNKKKGLHNANSFCPMKSMTHV